MPGPADRTENDALRAVTETWNRLTGSLTGRSLDEKLQEYTSVYGEILLAMHNRLNDLDRENRSLRKELALHRRRLHSLDERAKNAGGKTGNRATWIALLALGLSLGVTAWQIWIHIKS